MISVSDFTNFIFEALEIASPRNMVSQTVADVIGTDLQIVNSKFSHLARRVQACLRDSKKPFQRQISLAH